MRNLNLILDQFKHYDDSIRVTTVQVFMAIGYNESTNAEPLIISDIVDKLHITMASASRHCKMLSDTRRQGDSGMALITITRDVVNGNRKVLLLTNRGKKLFHNVSTLLE